MVGILFQPPSEFNVDLFWDDDYEGGNFKKWLKKKYTGPYLYRGNMEEYDTAQKDVNNLLERFSMIEVGESFEEYSKRIKEGLSVLDDVGGLSGFAEFLGVIYEGWLREQRAEYRAWAKSLGWSAAKVSNDKMI